MTILKKTKVKTLFVLMACSFLVVTFTFAQHPTTNKEAKRVAVMLYENAIQFDFVNAMEIFRVAGQFRDYEVYSVGDKDTIATMGGDRILPKYNLTNAPNPDVIIIGGGEWSHYDKNSKLAQYLIDQHKRGVTIFSICTGAYVLAKAGLLDNIESTSIHIQLDLLQKLAPKTKVVKKDFVDTGTIVTAAGAGTAIDAALHLVSRLSSLEKAKWVAETYMDYKYWKGQ